MLTLCALLYPGGSIQASTWNVVATQSDTHADTYDEDVFLSGLLAGHRTAVIRGSMWIEVTARCSNIPNPLTGDSIAHEVTAYCAAATRAVLYVASGPGPFSPKPSSAQVQSQVGSSGSYVLDNTPEVLDCDLYMHWENHAQGMTDEHDSDHLLGTSSMPEKHLDGTFPLSATSSWISHGMGTSNSFESGRVSATAHATIGEAAGNDPRKTATAAGSNKGGTILAIRECP